MTKKNIRGENSLFSLITWNPWVGLNFEDKTEHCLPEVPAEVAAWQSRVEVVGDVGDGDGRAVNTLQVGVT